MTKIAPTTVTVLAVDPDGHRQTINVTIKVLDVNEGPKIDRTYVDRSTDQTPLRSWQFPTGHTAGDRLPTEISHVEVDRRSSQNTSQSATQPGSRTIRRRMFPLGTPHYWTQTWTRQSYILPTTPAPL